MLFEFQLESQINNLEQEQINIHTTYKSQLEQLEENMKSEREAKVKKILNIQFLICLHILKYGISCYVEWEICSP